MVQYMEDPCFILTNLWSVLNFSIFVVGMRASFCFCSSVNNFGIDSHAETLFKCYTFLRTFCVCWKSYYFDNRTQSLESRSTDINLFRTVRSFSRGCLLWGFRFSDRPSPIKYSHPFLNHGGWWDIHKCSYHIFTECLWIDSFHL